MGRGHKKVSDEHLMEAYTRSGNIWVVAQEVGLCGQSVHERLGRLGIIKAMRYFTENEKQILFTEYEKYASAGKLAELAEKMSRTKHFICRQAKELGLTDSKRPKPDLPACVKEARSKKAKEWILQHGHPRGFLGGKHGPEVRAVLSKKSKAHWDSMTATEVSEFTLKQMKARASKSGLARQRPETTWKSGWRTIGGIKKYFRSRWEANYARYLDWLKNRGEILSWEHEPETFWFEKIRRGCRSYLPDFRVTEKNKTVYHEVKGWMDARSVTKIRRMKLYYPEIQLIVIGAKEYRKIELTMKPIIGDWES